MDSVEERKEESDIYSWIILGNKSTDNFSGQEQTEKLLIQQIIKFNECYTSLNTLMEFWSVKPENSIFRHFEPYYSVYLPLLGPNDFRDDVQLPPR